jgi:quinol monooxygenase YgiN
MVYTIVCHLYAKEGKEVEEKIRSKLVEASNVYVKDAGTLSWHVMQDHADPRKWTIVERYEKRSVCAASCLYAVLTVDLSTDRLCPYPLELENSRFQPVLRCIRGLHGATLSQEARAPSVQRARHESSLIVGARKGFHAFVLRAAGTCQLFPNHTKQ